MQEILSSLSKLCPDHHPSESWCTELTWQTRRCKEELLKKQTERSNDSCAARRQRSDIILMANWQHKREQFRNSNRKSTYLINSIDFYFHVKEHTSPMHWPTQGQWWSKRSTQLLQMEQWEQRGGRYSMQVSQYFTLTGWPLTVTSFVRGNWRLGVCRPPTSIETEGS